MKTLTEEEDRGKEVFMTECIIKVTKDTTRTSSMIITTKISTMGTGDTMVTREAAEETMKMVLARSRVREGQIRGKGDTTNLAGEATTRRAWQTHQASLCGKRTLNA